VHGVDDFCVIYAAKIDGGDVQVGMADLALNGAESDAFAGHLDGVGVPGPGAARSGDGRQRHERSSAIERVHRRCPQALSGSCDLNSKRCEPLLPG
jgi:hypothetical protein